MNLRKIKWVCAAVIREGKQLGTGDTVGHHSSPSCLEKDESARWCSVNRILLPHHERPLIITNCTNVVNKSSFQSLWVFMHPFSQCPSWKSIFLAAPFPLRSFWIELLQSVEGQLGAPVELLGAEPGPPLSERKLRNFLSHSENVVFLSLTSPVSSDFFITAWTPHLEDRVCSLISLWEQPKLWSFICRVLRSLAFWIERCQVCL